MIKLHKLTYKNFKSVGNVPVIVQLDERNTTFISGTNGSGKSTILSALCFVLFGKAYGTVNKPLLVNSINQKQCLVTIDFSVGGKKYSVHRGIKPAVFDIYEDGVLRKKSADSARDDQKILEQHILKMNYRAFTQTVIMGAEYYIPFMRLDAAKRREFIEDLLDIRVISAMSKLQSDKNKLLKESLRTIESSILNTKEKIRMMMSFIKTLESKNTDKGNDTEITRVTTELGQLSEQMQIKVSVVESLKKELLSYPDVSEELGSTRFSIKQAVSEVGKLNERIESYKELCECQTCGQRIDDDHKLKIVGSLKANVKAIMKDTEESFSKVTNLNELTAKRNEVLEKIAYAEKEVRLLAQQIDSDKKYLDRITTLQPNNDSTIKEEKKKLHKFGTELESLLKQKQEETERKGIYDIATQMLLDSGIKAKIIKQYIPTINKRINKYLSDLDFFVSFHLDENFNETVKSRHRDEFTYEAFSAGQKLRIDLALTFAFRDIAKMKNSVNINLLVLDEIDSPIDEEGALLMYSLLRKISAENIFVISHKQGMGDKFDAHYEFELKNNFSEMKEVV